MRTYRNLGFALAAALFLLGSIASAVEVQVIDANFLKPEDKDDLVIPSIEEEEGLSWKALEKVVSGLLSVPKPFVLEEALRAEPMEGEDETSDDSVAAQATAGDVPLEIDDTDTEPKDDAEIEHQEIETAESFANIQNTKFDIPSEVSELPKDVESDQEENKQSADSDELETFTDEQMSEMLKSMNIKDTELLKEEENSEVKEVDEKEEENEEGKNEDEEDKDDDKDDDKEDKKEDRHHHKHGHRHHRHHDDDDDDEDDDKEDLHHKKHHHKEHKKDDDDDKDDDKESKEHHGDEHKKEHDHEDEKEDNNVQIKEVVKTRKTKMMGQGEVFEPKKSWFARFLGN